MFKNVIVYRIAPGWEAQQELLEENLARARFAPCTATQERAAGWVEPRGEANGPLVESVGGQWALRFMVEAKAVPASVVRREVDKRAAQIEQQSGRKPGRREMKELKEDALLALLPMAFTRQGTTPVWIDREAGLLVVGAANQARADEIATALVEAAPGLSIALLDTRTSAQAAMAAWLDAQEPPAGFSIDRECELKAADESRAVVRYARHPLDIEEVRQHIAQGKLPTRLALTWEERVSFVLTEGLQLRKVSFLEGVFDGAGGKPKDEGFDADVAIATGELRQLLPDLIAALGGEAQPGDATAAVPAAAPAEPAAPAASPAPAAQAADEDPPW